MSFLSFVKKTISFLNTVIATILAAIAMVFAAVIIFLISSVGVFLFLIVYILAPIYYGLSLLWRRKRTSNDKPAEVAGTN